METTSYELPAQGTTLLGYVVRRMHKTRWLSPIESLVADGQSPMALAHLAVYALVASTSYGRAGYQPTFNPPGETVAEVDPATGADVWARVIATRPRIVIDYEVTMPDRSVFGGTEEILGTTVGFRGLGMPAPSRFAYRRTGYTATLDGTITSELTLAIFGGTRIRGYGSLAMSDSAGNRGEISIDREQRIETTINGARYGVNLGSWTVARPAVAVPGSV